MYINVGYVEYFTPQLTKSSFCWSARQSFLVSPTWANGRQFIFVQLSSRRHWDTNNDSQWHMNELEWAKIAKWDFHVKNRNEKEVDKSYILQISLLCND